MMGEMMGEMMDDVMNDVSHRDDELDQHGELDARRTGSTLGFAELAIPVRAWIAAAVINAAPMAPRGTRSSRPSSSPRGITTFVVDR